MGFVMDSIEMPQAHTVKEIVKNLFVAIGKTDAKDKVI